MIERKAEGKEIVASDEEAPKATKAPDLMAALEQSIAEVKGKGAGKAKKAPAKAKKARKNGAKKKAAQKKALDPRQGTSSPSRPPVGTEPPGRGRRA